MRYLNTVTGVEIETVCHLTGAYLEEIPSEPVSVLEDAPAQEDKTEEPKTTKKAVTKRGKATK